MWRRNIDWRIEKVNNQTKIRSPQLKVLLSSYTTFALSVSNIQTYTHKTIHASIDLMLFDRQDIVSVKLSVKWEKPSIALVTILKVSISFSCSAIFFPSNQLRFTSCDYFNCLWSVRGGWERSKWLASFVKCSLLNGKNPPFCENCIALILKCPLENTFSCR